MWRTVDWFKTKLGQDAPQFYGKWPFIRILGMQEPMSVLASLLNFMANFHMVRKMLRKMSSRSQFKSLWVAFGFVSLNTWFWSAIFHSRDSKFTEKMDYFR
jgi:post-GPI attachment to proteins factor 3